MRPFAVASVLVAFAALGCQDVRTHGPITTPTSFFPEYDQPDLLAMSRALRFRAADGVVLEGRLFGEGEVGIVLDHMGDGDQGQWWQLAGLLADRGYAVLTYNRRGACPGGALGCSQGEDDGGGWKDVVGAVAALRSAGAERVAVGGASQGAMESLYAATRGDADVDGLLWVAGADLYGGVKAAHLVRSITGPKLFLAGRFDGDLAALAGRLSRVALPPKELVILETGEHGTDILAYEEPAIADRFRQAVIDLLAEL
jgi:pimeloyl-ACP methyl ester carboxylesterase